ncbi:MAG: prolyl oligopeptidase family serine peptidase [bacterium]|nr:prolyl oligopeptidase family serine peptidase [bacterium]
MTVSTVEFMPGLYADVHAPTRPGDYPVITLTFGRGWSIGDRTQLSELARYLASRGMVAVNGEHRTLLRLSRLTSMAGEVMCLAAAAPNLAADHLTRPAPPVWLLGYSSGAHLAALATLTDRPLPPRCPHAPGEIAGMIGLGGPYDIDDLWNSGIPDHFFDAQALAEELPNLASLLEQGDLMAMQLFLHLLTGASPDDAAQWGELNPLSLAGRFPERSFLLVTGDEDELIFPRHSERFAEALQAGGHNVSIEVIPHTNHAALTDPDRVGELIRTFVDGAS